tara:strand:- start:280 stop:573 length:294 start_codon:yes stop_codon:yes gene_type:complete
MRYKQVFEEKQEFMIRHDVGVTRFCYQENEDKGEFTDQDGNVMSQLYEADRSKEWFVVAGMFMGEVILKTIPYYRIVRPSSAHIIKTNKYIDTNYDK